MTIAYAPLHQRLLYRGEDTGLYAVALENGKTFFSRRQPALYDRQANLISTREVPPGSYVKIKYAMEHGRHLMEAVQVVTEPAGDSPFDPVPDDGHL